MQKVSTIMLDERPLKLYAKGRRATYAGDLLRRLPMPASKHEIDNSGSKARRSQPAGCYATRTCSSRVGPHQFMATNHHTWNGWILACEQVNRFAYH